MASRHALCLLFVLGSLLPAGCAGGGRHPAAADDRPPVVKSAEDREHEDLERELSLYSD